MRTRPDEIPDPREERRRERIKAIITPWIVMGSIVGSVAMLMWLIRSCGGRMPGAQ
jgi:hypothetical protein